MSKVFNQVIKDGVAVPVWDDKAHAEISAVSAGISGHLNDNVKHISNADREKWNKKVDPSALNDYTYFSSFSSHSANNTVHVTEPDRIKWNAKVDPSAIADMATTAWVEGKGYLTAHQDLSEYATTAWVDEQHYLTAHQDLSDYATSSWVTAQGYLTAHQDLSEYATTAWVDEQHYLTAHQDLSEYAKSAWVTAQGYLTAHQSLAEYATSSWVTAQGYLTAHQDLSDYATTAWVEGKGYLTAHQSLENYYTKNETSGAEQIAGALNDKANESDLSAFELEYRAYISGISGAIASGTAASAWLAESASQLATTADVNDLEQAFNEYVSGISADIASGVAASAWLEENAGKIQNLSAGDYITINENVISVSGLDTLISGNNGISAEWNTETSGWDIGLEKENLAYARYTANRVAAAEEAADVTVGNLLEAERYADKITKNEDDTGLLLEAGLYHVDIRLTLNVTDPTPAYNTVKLVCGFSPERTTEHELDCSYAHNESICLSFDAMVGANGTAAIKIENLPKGVGYTLSNFNIHEIVNVAGILASSQTDIVAGDGLSKNGNELAVKLGGGLKFDNDKNLTIAVGNGLKISQSQLTTDLELVLDDVAEETVQEVQQISNDLDEKVTTTYAQANITETADMTSQSSAANGSGSLIGYLFTVPIKNQIYIQDDVDEDGNQVDKVTVVGLYCSQTIKDEGNVPLETPVIIGLYEYDPSFPHEDGTFGRTIALCDTGPVTLETGYHEYPMKNFNTAEAEKTLKSSNMYYAAMYISKGIVGGSGLKIASCPGYTDAFNKANPLLSMDQDNIEIDIRKGANPGTSFNDFGFSWKPDPNNPGKYLTNDYHERPSLHRPFMQFRNKPL